MAKVKHYAEFKSSTGTYYKIEIWDEDYTGTTPDEFKVTGKGFDLTYSGQTDDIYSPIIGSSVSFGMYVEGAAQVAFISALRQYQQDRFYVRIKRGATEAAATYYWSGYIVQDIVEIEDVSKPYVFEIQATDGISKLKDTLCGTSFFRKSTNQFLNALSQAGALGIYDTTDEVLAVVMNWWAEEMTYSTTTNPLDETWLDFHAFDTIDEDGFYTNKNWYEILAQVCTIFGLRFYFSNGQYRLEQIFQRDVASMTEHVYQKDGTKASSGTVSYERTINQTSGKAKLAGNIYNFLPAVNDVSITLNQEPKAMTGVTWDNSNDPDLELGLVSSALQNQLTLDFNHQIKLFLTTNVNQNPIYAKLRLNVELFDFNNNVTYYLKRTYSGMTPSAVSWTTTQAGSGYEIIVGTFREFSAQVALGGTDVIQVGGPTSIVTPPIPEDGDLSLNWDFVSFVESNGSVRGLNIGNSSTYKMTLQSVTTSFGSIQNQTTTIRAVSPNADINGSVSYELPQTNIFTGQGERGSLVKQTNVGGLLIKVPYGNWREGNSGSYVEVQKLICQEFLKLMDEPVQKYAGSFFSDHDFRQRLTFDSKAWVQLGGTFSANNDEWDGEWFVINLASVVPVFDDGVNVGTSSVGGVGGNSFNGNTGFTGIDVVTLDVGGEAEVGGSVDIGGGLDVTGTSTLGTTDVGNFTTTDQVNVTINEIDATASGTTTIEGRNNTNFISWSGGAGSHVLNLPSSENGMVLNFHVDDTITEEKKIVLTPQTGELIDGDSTYTIETGLEDITLLAYDSNWFLSGATGTQGTVEKLHVSIRNDEGSILPAGTPIYSKGEIGGSDRILVGKADASTSAKMPCIGITTEQLAVDADGLAIVTGIYNTNISGFTGLSVGDIMYVANGGGLTKTKPTGSNLIQNVGIILKTNGTTIQGFNVSAIGRTNDVPNLTTGKVWVGTATNTSESGVVHLDETNTRLGVNNTTPTKTLDVDGDALVSGGFQVSLSSGEEFKINPANTDREWYIDTTNADHLKKERNMVLSADPDNVHASTTIGFRIDNSTLMQLNSSGNLGIGTTSQTEKLHVAGKISNDQFQIPNTAGTSGQILQWPSTGTTLEWADAGGGGGVNAGRFNHNFNHGSNNSSLWYYLPNNTLVESSVASTNDSSGIVALNDGYVSKVRLTNVDVSGVGGLATQTRIRVEVNGTVVYTSSYNTHGTLTQYASAVFTLSSTDATFSAGNQVVVRFNANGIWYRSHAMTEHTYTA
jgi:hypothetical protein